MIIVLGATGNIGREVVKHLAQHKQHAILLSRHPQRSVPAFAGHQHRMANLDDLSSLTRAMHGGSRLLLVSPNSEAMQQQQINAIHAAHAAGIRHIVKISGTPKSVRQDSPSAVGRAHWNIEQVLKATMPVYSILQCNFFMQNLLGLQADMVKKSAKITLPFAADTVFRFIDVRDIAAAAVKLLIEEPAESRTYNISGAASSFAAMSKELGVLLGRNISYKQVPLWLTKIVMKFRGLPGAHIRHQMEMARLYQQGISDDPSADVLSLTGQEPVVLRDFLLQHLHHFQTT